MTVIGEAFVAVRPETGDFAGQTESALQSAFAAIPGPAIFGALGAGAAIAALDIGSHFEDAFQQIAKGTGATKEQMAGLDESFKTVLASGPDSMGKVADALTLVSQRTKLSGADLDAFTETELKLARITGEDVKSATDETTKALANYGIQGAGPSKAALEQLLAVSEGTGIGLSSLADSVSGKAGAVFRGFGIDIGSAASIMGTLQAAGVNTGPVIMSLSKAMTSAQKDGKDVHTVLSDLFDTLKSGTPGTAAYEDAIKTLGSRGFQSLRDAVQTGKLTLDEFTGSMAEAPGLIDRVADENLSLGDKFDIVKNKALVALEPIGTFAVDLAGKFLDSLLPALDLIGGAFSEISGAFQAFVAAFQAGDGDITSSGLAGWFEHLGNSARDVFDTLVEDWDLVVNAFQANDTFGFGTSDGPTGWLLTLGATARTVFDSIVGAWNDLVSGFQGGGGDGPFARLGEIIRTVTDFITDNAEPIFLSFAGVFAAVAAGGAIELVAGAIGGIVSVLALLVGALASPVVLIGALVAALVVAYQNSETFRNIVQEVGDFISGTLVPALQEGASWLADHWQPVALGVATAIGGLIVPLVAAYVHFEAFRDIVNNVAEVVGSAVADLVRFFEERWSKISDAVMNVGKAFEVLLAVAIAPFVLAWQYFHEQILAVVQLVWGEIEDVLSAAVEIIGDVFDIIVSVLSGNWGDAWNDVLDIFNTAWGLLRDSFGNLLSFVVSFFSSLPGNILSALGDLASALAPFAASALVFFASLPGEILSAIAGFAAQIISWMGDSLVALAEALPGLFDTVLTFWIGMPARILGALVQADIWLVDTGASILSGLYNGINSFLPIVESWLAGLPKWFLDRLADAPSWLASLGGQILQGLVNGLEFAIGIGGALWNWAIGLPGKFLNMLGDAAQWMVGLGGDILDGLKTGIDNAWHDITDYIKGKAGDLIHDFTHPWDINSPSKVTMKLGGDIMEGLRVGLGDSHEETAAAFTDHAYGLMSAFSGAIDAGSALPQAALDRIALRPPGITDALPGGESIGNTPAATDQTHALLREMIEAVKGITPVALAVSGAGGGTPTTAATTPDSETIATLRQVAVRMRQP